MERKSRFYERPICVCCSTARNPTPANNHYIARVYACADDIGRPHDRSDLRRSLRKWRFGVATHPQPIGFFHAMSSFLGIGLGLGIISSDSGVTPSTLLDSLVSYWKMDEASGNAVDSVGANDLTQIGTVSRTAGKINNCATSFSDSNYFSHANNTDLDLYNKDFSISMWVGNSSAGGHVFLAKGTALSDAGSQLTIGKTTSAPGGIYAQVGSTGSFKITGEAITTAFRNIVVTFVLSTKLLSIYVDNVKYTQTLTIAPPNAGGNLFIGRTFSPGTSAAADIDELALWSRALTDAEVQELYNGGSGKQPPF